MEAFVPPQLHEWIGRYNSPHVPKSVRVTPPPPQSTLVYTPWGLLPVTIDTQPQRKGNKKPRPSKRDQKDGLKHEKVSYCLYSTTQRAFFKKNF